MISDRSSFERADAECAVANEEQCSTNCKIRAHRVFRKRHGNAHCWRGDYERKRRVVRHHDLCCSDQQFAVMMIEDRAAQTSLDDGTKASHILCVNPAIHKAEAIGRTYDGIYTDFKDRALMNGDIAKVTAEARPCSR